MEVAIIDWKTIDSRVVVDDLYEHINAPKWVDLSAPSDPVDDEAWFCRPGCDHPKSVEDFFNEKERTPISNSKIQRSASVSDIPPYHWSNRDATLKKRGTNQPFGLSNKDTKYFKVVVEDAENQDPNFSTPPQQKAKLGKEAMKSSVDRKQASDANERTPKLRSTLSARNLFSGGDLLSKVSEFCNELKKLAMRAQDRESPDNVEKQGARDHVHENGGVLNEREKERMPLLEQSKEKCEVVEMSSSKGKLRRKKKNDDSENTPISVNVKGIRHLEAEGKLPIRTCPPTPQCFSAGFGNSKSSTPKPFRARPLNQERGILQELKQIEKDVTRVEKKSNHGGGGGGGGGEVAEKEARSLDVFWFLKPCTLSN